MSSLRDTVSLVVDARALHASGIGRYLRELLARIIPDRRFGRLLLLGDVEELAAFAAPFGAGERVVLRAYPTAFYAPAVQLAWLRLLLRGEVRADVYFFPHYDAPLLLPPRSVVTVQDLIHFRVPEAFPATKRAAAGLLLRRVASRARRILVSSSSTRTDLVERLPRSASRIEVIPLGVGGAMPDPLPADSGCLPKVPFLLCVGNRKRHKNLRAAVETLALLREALPDLRLVVAGRSFPEWQAVVRRARELGVGDRLEEREGASDAELGALYRGAEALLFPSYYEGFGLPLLEAMAAGCPVIASRRASIPEVVGEAALLVHPDDHRAMADAVLRLHRDPALRSELIRRGRDRAAQLPWERTARETADLLFRVGTAPV